MKALDEGEYYRALGVSERHSRIDIETASESLSAHYPNLAARLSGITQVVAVPEKREIFAICRDFRDQVLKGIEAKYGDASARLEGCKRQVWSCVQTLMRCDFEKADIKIGPAAAESLARNGQEWITKEVLNCMLCQLQPRDEERERGLMTRSVEFNVCRRCNTTRNVTCSHCEGQGKLVADEVLDDGPPILVDDPEEAHVDVFGTTCENCGGSGTVPCDCYDTYRFGFRPDSPAGTVIVGRGHRTGQKMLAILDHPVPGERPAGALVGVHMFYNMSQNLKWDMDVTLEDAEENFVNVRGWHQAIGCAILCAFLGLLGGGVCGEWGAGILTGTAASVPLFLVVRLRHWRLRSGRSISRRGTLLENLVLLLATGTTSILVGTLLASWTVGCCVLLFFILILGGMVFCCQRLVT